MELNITRGVEIAPSRGQIFLHTIAIGKHKVYPEDFYKAPTIEEKAKVINVYEKDKLNMIADIGPFNEDQNYKAACVGPNASYHPLIQDSVNVK